MWLLVLAGCGVQLGNHCVIDRAPGGDIRVIANREMKNGKLIGEEQYFSQFGDVSAVASYTYVDDLWTATSFNSDPGFSDEPTQLTEVGYDAEGRPILRQIIDPETGLADAVHEYEWEGDRLLRTNNTTLFTSWEETFEWDGDSATVLQLYLGDRVVREFREYTSTPLTWPVLNPDLNLPGLAFTSIHVDRDEDGLTIPDELVWEQEVDENGIPSFSRFYDANGSLFTQTEWDDCPPLGPEGLEAEE